MVIILISYASLKNKKHQFSQIKIFFISLLGLSFYISCGQQAYHFGESLNWIFFIFQMVVIYRRTLLVFVHVHSGKCLTNINVSKSAERFQCNFQMICEFFIVQTFAEIWQIAFSLFILVNCPKLKFSNLPTVNLVAPPGSMEKGSSFSFTWMSSS